MMRYLAFYGGQSHHPHFTEGKVSLRSTVTDVDKAAEPEPQVLPGRGTRFSAKLSGSIRYYFFLQDITKSHAVTQAFPQ